MLTSLWAGVKQELLQIVIVLVCNEFTVKFFPQFVYSGWMNMMITLNLCFVLYVRIQLSYDSEQECSVWHKLYQSVSVMKYLNPLHDLWVTATAVAATTTDCVGECRTLVPYRSDRTERTFLFEFSWGLNMKWTQWDLDLVSDVLSWDLEYVLDFPPPAHLPCMVE